MPNPANRRRAMIRATAYGIFGLANVTDPGTQALIIEALEGLVGGTDRVGPEPGAECRTDWGERGYVLWRWNSPGHDLVDPRPRMVLQVDALQYGRVVDFRMSPRQAYDLCGFGVDAVEQQRVQFGLPEAVDYDVRKPNDG